jgi:hypothetical protein
MGLRPLLKSTEIEELRRSRSDHAEHQPHRDGQRNQPTTLCEDGSPFWSVWHAWTAHMQNLRLPD